MAVSAQHLIEGGSVMYRITLPRPGAASEVRLKPARVLDVERAAARIHIHGEDHPRTVKFSCLEPDVEYLASVHRKEIEHAQELAQAARNQISLVDQQHLEKPAANEQTAPPIAKPSLTATLADHASVKGEFSAFAEMADALKTQIDKRIVSAPREEVAELMQMRRQIEAKVESARPPPPAANTAQTPAEPAPPAEPATPTIALKMMPADSQETPKMPAKKARPVYTQEQKDKVLKMLAAGKSPSAVASHVGIPVSTINYWQLSGKDKATYLSKQAAGRKRISAERRGDTAPAKPVKGPPPPVAPPAPMPPPAAIDDGDESLRDENKRLRATLTVLLGHETPTDAETLGRQNRQLRRMVDLLLGIRS